MHFDVGGREVYAYTGSRPFVPSQPTVLFVHGAANDHSVEIWQTDVSRVLAHACAQVRTPISASRWSRHFPGLDHRPPCRT